MSNIINITSIQNPGSYPNISSYKIISSDFKYIWATLGLVGWFSLVAIMKIGYENFKHSPKVPTIFKSFPESCILILLGIVASLFLTEGHDGLESYLEKSFTDHNFFIFILPPIIFEAAYTVDLKSFSKNSFEIFIYAVIGTLLNVILLAFSLYAIGFLGIFGEIFITEMSFLRYFLYASIISAVDPVAVLAVFEEIHVNSTLYILVFGESLMNDGMAVVLYNVFEQLLKISEIGDINFSLFLTLLGHFLYIVLGGLFIGIFFGFLAAFVTKYTNYAKTMESIIVFGISYASYLVAEGLKTSAIIALVFCAFTMRNYVHHNINKESDIARVAALKTHALPRCAFLRPFALCVALFFYGE